MGTRGRGRGWSKSRSDDAVLELSASASDGHRHAGHFRPRTAFILGLETVLLMRPGRADDAQQLPTQRFKHLMRRDPGKDEQGAIANLEPVLAAVLIAVQETQEKSLR